MYVVVAIFVGGIAVGLVGDALATSATQLPDSTTGASSGSPVNYVASNGAAVATSETEVTTMVAGTTVVSSATEPNTVGVNPSSNAQDNTNTQITTTVSQEPSSGDIEFFGNVTIDVSSTFNALNEASAIAYAFGGYVAYSSYSNTSSIAVIRVPADDYSAALGQVESLGNLTGLSSSSNDVSVQYTNLNATLASLLTEQTSLLRLENASTTLNSTLLLENELQSVDTQINEIQSEILQTQLLIDYSTITVTFNILTPAIPPAPLTLKLTATPKSGETPLAVTFNAIVTGGIGPYIVNYNFGDGTSYQGDKLIHTFTEAGTFNVTVTATDSNGSVQQAWTVIQVTSPPTSSQFSSFTGFVSKLLIGVVEGIIEVAVVVLPIALVVGVVIIPFRNRFRTNKQTKE